MNDILYIAGFILMLSIVLFADIKFVNSIGRYVKTKTKEGAQKCASMFTEMYRYFGQDSNYLNKK